MNTVDWTARTKARNSGSCRSLPAEKSARYVGMWRHGKRCQSCVPEHCSPSAFSRVYEQRALHKHRATELT
jgi:hypothetical protein